MVSCNCCLLSFVCTKESAGAFCRLMARVKKTAKPVDSSKVTDSASDAAVSFKFGLSRVTSIDLDEFAKAGWFARDLVRPSEGEAVPNPRDDEVVVYKEFLAGLRFLSHPLVVGVLKRFNLKFNQLNPSSFVKLTIYVWGCKSQGVEPDLEGFVRLHRVHP